MYKDELVGIKTVEHFDGREDFLEYRSVTYGPMPIIEDPSVVCSFPCYVDHFIPPPYVQLVHAMPSPLGGDISLPVALAGCASAVLSARKRTESCLWLWRMHERSLPSCTVS
jgi:hypothetical protein